MLGHCNGNGEHMVEARRHRVQRECSIGVGGGACGRALGEWRGEACAVRHAADGNASWGDARPIRHDATRDLRSRRQRARRPQAAGEEPVARADDLIHAYEQVVLGDRAWCLLAARRALDGIPRGRAGALVTFAGGLFILGLMRGQSSSQKRLCPHVPERRLCRGLGRPERLPGVALAQVERAEAHPCLVALPSGRGLPNQPLERAARHVEVQQLHGYGGALGQREGREGTVGVPIHQYLILAGGALHILPHAHHRTPGAAGLLSGHDPVPVCAPSASGTGDLELSVVRPSALREAFHDLPHASDVSPGCQALTAGIPKLAPSTWLGLDIQREGGPKHTGDRNRPVAAELALVPEPGTIPELGLVGHAIGHLVGGPGGDVHRREGDHRHRRADYAGPASR